jgi:hypothetical protein
VTASTRYVSYLSSTILDPAPGGNGDGILNPGEIIKLPTWVKNWGQQTAGDVSATLRTHDPSAQISDSVKTFGDIAAGDSAWTGDDGFGLSVNTGLPNGYAVTCSLICRDELDTLWVSYVTLRVGAPVLGFVDKAVADSASSQPNGKLDPGETADLLVTIANSGIGNAYGVHAVLRSTDARLTVPDSTANFGTVLHESTAVNSADHFTLTASASIPMETPVVCSLDIYGDAGYVGHAAFTLVVGEIRTIDPIPDGPRSPALYWAYDEVDAGYSECPDFSWIELRGVGTPISFSDDQTQAVTVPAAFGPIRFYGQNYSQLSICSNGWVGLGTTSSSAYSNSSLPASGMPPMVCLNWDDLYPPEGRGVYYYSDTANHRFVVEYDSVPYYSQRSSFDFFEVIFSDTAHGSQGNSTVTVMYRTAAQTSSSTLGIQDNTGGIALQCLLDGGYTRGASPWAPAHAIKYTTAAPLMAVEEPTGGASVARRPVEVWPNPFSGSAHINWQLANDGRVDLKVYDASGRVVRTLVNGTQRAGSYTATWDGTDDHARRVAHGIYFVRLATPNRTTNVKTILTK